jgi:hypothetical protein
MIADTFRAIMAPLTAYTIIVGGGFILWQTYPDPAAGNLQLIVSGLMGGAATFLFGDAVQRRTNESQPTVTTSAGPPSTTTITPSGQTPPTGEAPTLNTRGSDLTGPTGGIG